MSMDIWKRPFYILIVSCILLYIFLIAILQSSQSPKHVLAHKHLSIRFSMNRQRSQDTKHLTTSTIFLQKRYSSDNISLRTTMMSSRYSWTSRALPRTNVDVVEIKVKGDTRQDWCDGLKFLYPTGINLTKTGDKLENISALYKVVNPYSANLIHNPKRLCVSSNDIFLISVVKSRVDNMKIRHVIRETWGREARSANNRLVFSLGHSSNRKLQKLVERENSEFQDILQGDFRDDYLNNSLKTMMGIQWAATFCSSARFVFFVDDDVIVNFKNLLLFYKSESENDKVLFSGNVKTLDKPIRDKRFKWYMPKEIYPYSCYPPYISGAITLTSGYVVRLLNIVLPYVRKFKYDDVFVAIAMQKLGIRPQKNHNVSIIRTTHKKMKNMIASHGYKSPSEYLNMYKSMVL